MCSVTRSELIQQLREALYQAESPKYDVLEFEIGETSFCFEYDEDER